MSSSASRNRSLTERTSWLVAAKTLAFVFTMAIPLLLVRRLPQRDFGLYKQIFLVINSAVTMLPLGFGMTAFYFLPREEQRRNQTVFNIVFFTAATTALFAAVLSVAPSILFLLFKEPEAVAFAPWVGLIVVLWATGSFLEIVTVANQDIGLATGAILAIQVTRATFFLLAAGVGGTLQALVVAAVLQGIVQLGALVWYLGTRFPGFWRAYDLSFLRRQLAYSLPFGVAGLLYSLQTDLHNYFVAHKFGATEYALYAVGCFQLPLFGILADSVGSVMIPRVSQLQYQQNRREIVLLTARAVRKLAAVYFPAYAFLLIMRREFIIGLFTDRYTASIPVFAVNLTLVPLGVVLVDPIMRAYAEHRHFLVKLRAALLIALLAGLSASINRFGLLGAISLVVISDALGRAAMLIKTMSILDVQRRDFALFTDVAKVAAAAAGAALVTAVARSLMTGYPALVVLAACALWFGIAYVTATFFLRVVTPEERALVRNALARAITRPWPRLVEAAPVARD